MAGNDLPDVPELSVNSDYSCRPYEGCLIGQWDHSSEGCPIRTWHLVLRLTAASRSSPCQWPVGHHHAHKPQFLVFIVSLPLPPYFIILSVGGEGLAPGPSSSQQHDKEVFPSQDESGRGGKEERKRGEEERRLHQNSCMRKSGDQFRAVWATAKAAAPRVAEMPHTAILTTSWLPPASGPLARRGPPSGPPPPLPRSTRSGLWSCRLLWNAW